MNDFTLRVFLQEVERFLSCTGMAPTRFGQSAFKKDYRHFVFRLRRGHSCNVRRIDEARQFMRAYQKKDMPANRARKDNRS